jgi:hypothetical protein
MSTPSDPSTPSEANPLSPSGTSNSSSSPSGPPAFNTTLAPAPVAAPSPATPPGLWSRTRALAAAVGAAFLGGIGVYLATRLTEGLADRIEAPLIVTRVHEFDAAGPLPPYFFMPESLGFHLEDVPDTKEIETWMRSRGAPAGSPQMLRLELRGRGEEPVTLNGVQVEVVRRTPPLRGWYVARGDCGAADLRMTVVDLDSMPPKVEWYTAYPFSKPSRTPPLLRVTRNDIETVEIHTKTESSYVEWRLVLFYTSKSGSGSIRLDDDGRPFRVTSEHLGRGYEEVWYDSVSHRSLERPTHRLKTDSGGLQVC